MGLGAGRGGQDGRRELAPPAAGRDQLPPSRLRPRPPGGERGLHIGPRARGPSFGQPRFTLSRRLETPEGAFAGVAATGVVSAYFAAVYAEAGLGEAARFTLFRADGAPLVVWPPTAGGGEAEPLAFPDHPPGPGRGELREGAGGALVAVRALADYPLLLVVELPLAAAMADWRARTRLSGAAVTAALAALGLLTVFGLRGAARQRALLGTLTAERTALEERVAERTAALAESEARFREMADFAPMMVWVTGPDGACTFLSRSWHAFTGQDPAEGLGFGWLEMVHPEDRPVAEATFRDASARAAPFRLDYRLRRAGGGWAWAIDAAAPRLGPDGAFHGYIGSVIDITERRNAEERRELMARELDHRAKNALAVVQAALRLTPKHDAAAFAAAVEGRVATLARAHGVLAEGRWQGASLRAVAEAELAAFLGAPGKAAPAATIDGPEVLLAPAAVQAVSMALHELATNATKYGALSAPGGRLEVAWSLDAAAGLLRLAWRERGGPRLPEGPPPRRGFGTRVVAATVEGQLGGRMTREWRPEGLACLIELPLPRVLAAAAPDAAPLAMAAQ